MDNGREPWLAASGEGVAEPYSGERADGTGQGISFPAGTIAYQTGAAALFPSRIAVGTLVVDGSVILPEWQGGDPVEYYAIELEAGVPITFSLRMVDLPDARPALFLTDIHGTPLTGESSYNTPARVELLTFTPTVSGTYYLAVDPNYALGVAALTASTSTDIPGGPSSTVELYPDSSRNSLFDFQGDIDWYVIHTDNGERVQVDFNLGFPPAELSNDDLYTMENTTPVVTLRRADGSIIDSSPTVSGGAGSYSFTFGAVPAGDYFVTVSHPLADVYPYTLHRYTEFDDLSAGNATTATIEIGGAPVRGILQGDSTTDVDGYRFSATAGQTILFDLNDGRTSHLPYNLVVRDSTGVIVAGSNSATDAHLAFTPASSGTYVVEVVGPYGMDQEVYWLSARSPVDDLPGDATTTATLGNGDSITFRSDNASDQDLVAVDLQEGQSLELTYSRDFSVGLSILDADGNTVLYPSSSIYTRDGVTYRTYSFDAPEAGRYYLSLTSADLGLPITVTTRIWDADAPDADPPPVSITLGPSGATFTGTMDFSGDIDKFSLSFEGDRGYLIRATDANGQPEIYFSIADLNGQNSIGAASFYGRPAGVLFSAPMDAAGTWVIRHNSPTLGTYTFDITPVEDDYSTSDGQFGQIVVDGTVAGQITFNHDVDRFAFTVNAGDILRFDLDTSEPGYAGLRVIDSNGNDVSASFQSLWSQDLQDYDNFFTHGGETAVFRFATAGTYHVEVTGTAIYSGGIIPTDYAISTQRMGPFSVPSGQAWMYLPGEIPPIEILDVGPAPKIAESPTVRLGWMDENAIIQDLDVTVGASQALFNSNRTTQGSHVTLIEANEYANLTNNGLIWAESTYGGIAVTGTFGSFSNDGSIVSLSARFGNQAVAATAVSFHNTGDIVSIQGTLDNGFFAEALSLAMVTLPTQPGTAVNAAVNDGLILAESAHGRSIAVSIADLPDQVLENSGDILAFGWTRSLAVVFDRGGVLVNTGTVAAIATAPVLSTWQTSVGVANTDEGQLGLTNSGLISADIAVDWFGQMTLTNTGLIEGLIYAFSVSDTGGDSITNSGVINGNILLERGNDVYDGRDGQLLGNLYLGTGNDLAQGGSGSDSFFGESGNDYLYGFGGNDFLSGGSGRDWIDGGAGADVMSGGDGADTLIGSGGDAMTGGDGGDLFVIASGPGKILVSDFELGVDKIAFANTTGVTGLSDLTMMQDGADVLITFASTTIRVAGVSLEMLTTRHFSFGFNASSTSAAKTDGTVIFEPAGPDPDLGSSPGDLRYEYLQDRFDTLGLTADALQDQPSAFDFSSISFRAPIAAAPVLEIVDPPPHEDIRSLVADWFNHHPIDGMNILDFIQDGTHYFAEFTDVWWLN